MKDKKFVAFILVLLIALAAAPLSQARQPADENRPITVMTWNVYLGAPIESLFQVSSIEDLLLKGTAIWATTQQTDFYERAEAIASQISLKRPDFIGLQEAALWRTQSPGDFISGNYSPNATMVAYDFLQILLDALKDKGLYYDVLAVVEGSDFEGPVFNPYSITGTDDIRLTDRDVILVRSDVRSRRFEYFNIQGGNYLARITLNVLGLPIDILSNWVSVDVQTQNRTFRFLTTHLSAFDPSVRAAQVEELLEGPLDTIQPVLLVGDLNSDPALLDPAYNILIASGFGDAWEEAGIGYGYTGWQDGDLLNPESALYYRVDHVLYNGDFRILKSDLVGEQQKDRTFSGLWPSDHAGVNAQLMFNTGKGR